MPDPTPPTALQETRRGPRVRYPLAVTIAAVFTALVLAVGLALIGYGFRESRAMALVSTNALVERIGQQVAGDVTRLYVPARQFVDLSAQVLASRDTKGAGFDKTVRYFVEALQLDPHLDAVYLANDEGDFLLVRPLRPGSDAARVLTAPPTARWAVQSTVRGESGNGIASERLLFLDQDLLPVAERPAAAPGFDPRERDWYRQARTSASSVTTDFYAFYTTKAIGLTFARRLSHGAGVVGADLDLHELATGLEREKVTPTSRIAVALGNGTLIALHDPTRAHQTVRELGDGRVALVSLSDLPDPLYTQLHARLGRERPAGRDRLNVNGRDWFVSIAALPGRTPATAGPYLAMLIPMDELLADVNRIRDRSVLMSLALLAVAVLLVLWISRHIAGSLRRLASEAENIREFRLDAPLTVRSRIAEVDALAATMGSMKSSLREFLAISRALSGEKDYAKVLELILQEARRVARADGGAVLMLDEEHATLRAALVIDVRTGTHRGGSGREVPAPSQLDLSPRPVPSRPAVDVETVRTGMTLVVEDVARETRFDCDAALARFAAEGYRPRSLLSVPMRDQKGAIIGILQLVDARGAADEVVSFRPEVVSYVEALASQAAVGLDVRRLLEAERALLDAFLQVIAGAIDAKSPYTSGHCQRVPELARLLAEAADAATSGPFADFHLDEDGWYQLRIASWLHDCGKVTTPEHVVDKATKLETMHDRIHEIRMRFEVLLCEAEIRHLRALAEPGADVDALQREHEARCARIRDDFAFVARCNVGTEFMPDESVERLRHIARQTWTRRLDDRIGISHEELERKSRTPAPTLPVAESVLADKPEHIIARSADRHPFGDNALGFDMPVPEHEYNLGELHNLAVRRGTLTPEERFKINEHIVQTLIMLKRLPFPRELRDVPDWAANHHEKMDGTGYPRRLHGEQMSVPERIMAIADIFEALTAADRPYKRANTLSESLTIMARMRDEGHIDPDLFDLFMTSGAWLAYARRFLRPEQLDRVDIAAYCSPATAGE
jgi:HD-GYP domain-containing protein (c-di-GMP phosphodiesterase class II)/HAMP domain-containing protein